MGYTMALPFLVGLYGSIAHYLRTGQRPDSLKDRFYPGPDGQRWQLPSYMNDVLNFQDDPTAAVWHKASPLLHTTVELLSHTERHGEKGVHPAPPGTATEPLLRAVGQAFSTIANQFVPFTGRSMWRDVQQGNVPQAAADFFGLTRAPRRMQLTEEQAQALRAWEERKRRLQGATPPTP